MKHSAIIVFLFFLSCKSDVNKSLIELDPLNKSEERIKDNLFRVELKVIVPKDDIFELFYTDLDSQEDFTESKKLSKNVLGNEENQIIEFIVPKEIFPYNFRIDLGNNKLQREIVIEEIILKFNNNDIVIKKDLIDKFFDINLFVDFNNQTGEAKLLEIDKRRDPFIVSKPILIKKVEIEL